MLYLIGPNGLVNRGFVNFQKIVWMTTVHVLRFRIKHPCHADNIRFSYKQILKTRFNGYYEKSAHQQQS